MELFEITFMEQRYYFTSFQEDINVGGIVYKAIPINRTEFSFELEKASLTITAPIKEIPFSYFLQELPVTPIKIIITRYPEGIQFFRGKVTGVKVNFSNETVQLVCVPEYYLKSVDIPKRTYGTNCPWRLGSIECGVKITDFTIEVQSSDVSINGTTLTSSAFATKPNNFFTNGFILTDKGEYIFILKHTGNTIILLSKIINQSFSKITVFAGCNKTLDDCKNKFNNICNFGGFPKVPTRNPSLEGF